jgi:hypothetical protein
MGSDGNKGNKLRNEGTVPEFAATDYAIIDESRNEFGDCPLISQFVPLISVRPHFLPLTAEERRDIEIRQCAD